MRPGYSVGRLALLLALEGRRRRIPLRAGAGCAAHRARGSEHRRDVVALRRGADQGREAAREWHRWATPPKRHEMLPGSEHGTDMLRPSQKTAGPLTDLLLSFVDGLGA